MITKVLYGKINMTKLDKLLKRKEEVGAAIQIAYSQQPLNKDTVTYLNEQYKDIVRSIKFEEACLSLEEDEV